MQDHLKPKYLLLYILGVAVLCYLLQIAIHPEFFLDPSSFYIVHDFQLGLNVNYLMADNFSRFHLPLANTYRHLGEPLGLYHVWLGIYGFQNLIYALIVRFVGLFTSYPLPFKFGYLSFNLIFNLSILLPGYYLLLRKVTRNLFAITIGLIYIALFGYYQLFVFDIKMLNNSALTPFFFLALIDFFCFRPSRRNFFLLTVLAALLFFYGPMESSRYYYAAFFLLIGIFVSFYLRIFDGRKVGLFFRNRKNYLSILLSAVLAGGIMFPALHSIFNEIPKFALPRSAMGLNQVTYTIVNFKFLNFALPLFFYNYIGISWVILLLLGAVWGKSRFKPMLLVYLLLTLIIPIYNTSSNLLVNLGYLLIFNSRGEAWFEIFTEYFTLLYVFFIVLAVDALQTNPDNTVQRALAKTGKRPQGWFWILLFSTALALAYTSSLPGRFSIQWILPWLYFYFVLLIAFALLFKFSIQGKAKLIKLSLVLIVFLELCFLSSSRNQPGELFFRFHDREIVKTPHIENLSVPSSEDFDNALYIPPLDLHRESHSLTTSLLEGKFYLPGDSLNPRYNFNTVIGSRFLRSDYFHPYLSVFNRKFNFLDLEKLEKYAQFNEASRTESGLLPVLTDICGADRGIVLDFSEGFSILKSLADLFEIRTEFNREVLLIFNQVYDPAWTLEIDGVEQPILNLDGYFMRFEVPEGRHQIRLWYRNPLLRGAILANYLLTGFLIIYLFYYYFFSGKYGNYPEYP